MNWLSFFSANQEISPEQLRSKTEKSNAGAFQLLDVRQPAEYTQEHIPGAMLIPLAELPVRLNELHPQTETVVYCRSGARSSSACQILRQNNFLSVYNLTGGMLSWNGMRAIGAENAGLEYFVKGDFTSILLIAYQMEDGLQDFYLHLASESDNLKMRRLLESMAQMEDGHKARIKGHYPKYFQQIKAVAEQDSSYVEGGFNPVDFASRYMSLLDSPESIFHLAMKMEAQAYDLYSRLAKRHDAPEIRDFFQSMADEELKHIEKLSKELDLLLD